MSHLVSFLARMFFSYKKQISKNCCVKLVFRFSSFFFFLTEQAFKVDSKEILNDHRVALKGDSQDLVTSEQTSLSKGDALKNLFFRLLYFFKTVLELVFCNTIVGL